MFPVWLYFQKSVISQVPQDDMPIKPAQIKPTPPVSCTSFFLEFSSYVGLTYIEAVIVK